jgi:predicted transcriptional regulator
VRDLVGAQRNHFAELETAAEPIVAAMKADPQDLGPAVRERLLERFGIQVRVMPVETMTGSLRRYDHHRKRLMLSETLAPASRIFAMCYQLGLMEAGENLIGPDRPLPGPRPRHAPVAQGVPG